MCVCVLYEHAVCICMVYTGKYACTYVHACWVVSMCACGIVVMSMQCAYIASFSGHCHHQYFIASSMKMMQYWWWEWPGNEASAYMYGVVNTGQSTYVCTYVLGAGL